MHVTLTARIADIEPETVHQGSVYDKSVELTMENGQSLTVFDGSWTVDEEDVGKRHEVVLFVYPREGGVRKRPDEHRRIASPTDPNSKWSYDVDGEVVTLDHEDEWFENQYDLLVALDVGVGELFLEPTGELREMISAGELTVGDFLHVQASRVDVIGLND